jgi:glycosyltransferase involved in cell wall biosynthesis
VRGEDVATTLFALDENGEHHHGWPSYVCLPTAETTHFEQNASGVFPPPFISISADASEHSCMKTVLFIQRVAADYRTGFFLKLHDLLQASDIQLRVIAGLPWPGDAVQDELDQLPFGTRMQNVRLIKNVYWQRGAVSASRNSDLVVFEQANSALHNYPLLLRWGHQPPQRIAFWGHGRNLTLGHRNSIREHWKKKWLHRVDWWFAYTQLTHDILASQGFPETRISVVNNAIDTSLLREQESRMATADKDSLYTELFKEQRPSGHLVGVFCGRLTAMKWLPFLFESIQGIQSEQPAFRMIIVGDGPERELVEKFCQSHSWCVYVGAKRGIERVPYLALGGVWLNPGLTGLSILDAFALGLPYVTTHSRGHGPEIAYLRPDHNGLLTKPTPSDYAHAILDLLGDERRLRTMQANARQAASSYSIEQMAERFHHGICSALAT